MEYIVQIFGLLLLFQLKNLFLDLFETFPDSGSINVKKPWRLSRIATHYARHAAVSWLLIMAVAGMNAVLTSLIFLEFAVRANLRSWLQNPERGGRYRELYGLELASAFRDSTYEGKRPEQVLKKRHAQWLLKRHQIRLYLERVEICVEQLLIYLMVFVTVLH